MTGWCAPSPAPPAWSQWMLRCSPPTRPTETQHHPPHHHPCSLFWLTPLLHPCFHLQHPHNQQTALPTAWRTRVSGGRWGLCGGDEGCCRGLVEAMDGEGSFALSWPGLLDRKAPTGEGRWILVIHTQNSPLSHYHTVVVNALGRGRKAKAQNSL